MRLAVLACLLPAMLTTIACDRHPRPHARKRNLVRLPIPWRRPSIHVAEDGAHATFSVRDTSGYYVVTPAGRGRTYEEVSPPLFAPKSTRVFYWGAYERDGRRRYDVVAGDTTVPTSIVEPVDLTTSRGGTRWAALGFVDPEAGADPAVRPIAVVVDGREMGRHAAVSRPDFSPDGAHVAWVARAESGQVTILADGAPIRTLDAPPPASDGPRFDHLAFARYLSDGRLLALVPQGYGWTVFRGDEQLATYGQNLIPGTTLLLAGPDTKASVVAGSFTTAENAPVAVWWERMPGAAERWRVVRDGAAIDGMVCDRYWDTQPPVVTADGTHVAYVCPTPTEAGTPLGRRWVVLDGRRFGTYIESWTLGVSDDGSHVAYGAAESLPIMTWRIFVNGIPRTPPAALVWRPRLSPDGEHVLWAGGPERGRRRLGIDGRTVTRFDDVMYGAELASPDTAVWVIRRGRTISRIEATL